MAKGKDKLPPGKGSAPPADPEKPTKRGFGTGAGKKKYTTNKRTIEVERIAATFNLSPFEVLCAIANGEAAYLGLDATTTVFGKDGQPYEEDTITLDHRLKAAAEASKYLYPRRVSVAASQENPEEKNDYADDIQTSLTEIAKGKAGGYQRPFKLVKGGKA